MGALLACFATLYSGMLFYIGYETDRIPEWSLDFASFVIIAALDLFLRDLRRSARNAIRGRLSTNGTHLVMHRNMHLPTQGMFSNHTPTLGFSINF